MSRILFVITKGEVGGAQKFVKEQAEICADIHEIYLSTNKEGWLTHTLNGIFKETLICRNIESHFSLVYLSRLISFIKKNKIELIIANSANAGLYGRLAAKIAGIKSIYVTHGWSSIYNGGRFSFLLNNVEWFLSRIGDAVLCVSEKDYADGRNLIKIDEKKLFLIHNSVFPIYQTRGSDVPLVLKLISLFRFAHPKRADLLIEAVGNMQDAELAIAGEGDGYEESIREAAQKNFKNIYFLGEVPSFANFHEYDCFILISESEGLPMSAIEAMSAGLPLILSNVGGCPELINNNGVLVENNVQSIQWGLQQVKEQYANYYFNARKYFDEKFNLTVNREKYLQLYSNILKRK